MNESFGLPYMGDRKHEDKAFTRCFLNMLLWRELSLHITVELCFRDNSSYDVHLESYIRLHEELTTGNHL